MCTNLFVRKLVCVYESEYPYVCEWNVQELRQNLLSSKIGTRADLTLGSVSRCFPTDTHCTPGDTRVNTGLWEGPEGGQEQPAGPWNGISHLAHRQAETAALNQHGLV